jgi:hypothetical protein
MKGGVELQPRNGRDLHAILRGHSLTFDAVLNSECPPAAGNVHQQVSAAPATYLQSTRGQSLAALALEFWSLRGRRLQTGEEARQIADNMIGFFRVLIEWKAAKENGDS